MRVAIYYPIATRLASMFSRHGAHLALLALVSTAAVEARDSLTVLDANGKTIGPVFDQADAVSSTKVPMQFGNRRFFVSLDRQGFAYSASVYYLQSSCAGDAYAPVLGSRLFSQALITLPRHTLLLAHDEPSALQVPASIRSADGTCTDVTPASARRLIRLGSQAIVLDDLFVPPFRIVSNGDVVDLAPPPPQPFTVTITTPGFTEASPGFSIVISANQPVLNWFSDALPFEQNVYSSGGDCDAGATVCDGDFVVRYILLTSATCAIAPASSGVTRSTDGRVLTFEVDCVGAGTVTQGNTVLLRTDGDEDNAADNDGDFAVSEVNEEEQQIGGIVRTAGGS